MFIAVFFSVLILGMYSTKEKSIDTADVFIFYQLTSCQILPAMPSLEH